MSAPRRSLSASARRDLSQPTNLIESAGGDQRQKIMVSTRGWERDKVIDILEDTYTSRPHFDSTGMTTYSNGGHTLGVEAVLVLCREQDVGESG